MVKSNIKNRNVGKNIFPGGKALWQDPPSIKEPITMVRTRGANSTPRFTSKLTKVNYHLITDPTEITSVVAYAKANKHLHPKARINDSLIEKGLIVMESFNADDLFYDAFDCPDITSQLYNLLPDPANIINFCNKFGLLFDEPRSKVFSARGTFKNKHSVLNDNYYKVPYAMFIDDFINHLKSFKFAFEYVQAVNSKDRDRLFKMSYRDLVCKVIKSPNDSHMKRRLLSNPSYIKEVSNVLRSSDFNLVWSSASATFDVFMQPFLERIKQRVIIKPADSSIKTEEGKSKPSANNNFFPVYVFEANNLIDVAYQQLYWQIVNPTIKDCVTCGKPFIPTRKDKKNCSDECRNKEPVKKFNKKRKDIRLRQKQKEVIAN